ncbi:MAG: NTPase [Caldisericia bacterium]|nr:NTPase [Caldisericia bacterium]
MKIFITGESGVGKTTLIEEISNELIKNGIKISGFITKEDRREGKRIGFKIVEILSKKEYLFASKLIESKIKFGTYFLHIENLEKILSDSLKKSFDFLIIDEIGKMEFYSNYFKETIFELMKSNKNIIAVLHRNFVDIFKIYGKIFILTRDNKISVKKDILKIII